MKDFKNRKQTYKKGKTNVFQILESKKFTYK